MTLCCGDGLGAKNAEGGQPIADKRARARVTSFGDYIAQQWEVLLAGDLSGFYFIGSLAHGGYSPVYSDIDVLLIAERNISASEIELVRALATSHSPGLSKKLSLFWSEPGFAAGRFPPLDRIDYLDHAVPIREKRRVLPPRPTHLEVRSYLSAGPLHNWSRQVARISALGTLTAHDHKVFLRALLYPARFLYSWLTGNVVSNDEAVAYVTKYNLLGPEIKIVASALRCRNDVGDPKALFSERHRLLYLQNICMDRVRNANLE